MTDWAMSHIFCYSTYNFSSQNQSSILAQKIKFYTFWHIPSRFCRMSLHAAKEMKRKEQIVCSSVNVKTFPALLEMWRWWMLGRYSNFMAWDAGTWRRGEERRHRRGPGWLVANSWGLTLQREHGRMVWTVYIKDFILHCILKIKLNSFWNPLRR